MSRAAAWGAKKRPRRALSQNAKGTVTAPPLPTERQGQRTVLAWLDLVLPAGSVVAHIANEAAVNPKWSAHSKARYFEERRKDGVLEGMPDLLICLRPARALFVEMKRIRGGRLSKAQKDRIAELTALAFPVTEARTIEDVRGFLLAHGVPLREALVPEVRAA